MSKHHEGQPPVIQFPPLATDGNYESRAADRIGPILPVRVELLRQLGRKRTQFSLGFMVLLPVILAIAFHFGSENAGPSSSSFIDMAQSSASNFMMVALFFSASFLLIVVVSLFFGDTIAAEASWSSLKYLLALPVPRARLLRQKIVVAALLTVGAVALLTFTSYGMGLLLYGNGPLITPVGETFTGSAIFIRLLLVTSYILIYLLWVAGLATLMTVATNVPLGAVGGAVLLTILSQILDQITALGDLRNFLPTHHAFSWTAAMSHPIDWATLTEGAFSALSYAIILVTAAFLVFRRKDITS